jgi:hypothetical protein
MTMSTLRLTLFAAFLVVTQVAPGVIVGRVPRIPVPSGGRVPRGPGCRGGGVPVAPRPGCGGGVPVPRPPMPAPIPRSTPQFPSEPPLGLRPIPREPPRVPTEVPEGPRVVPGVKGPELPRAPTLPLAGQGAPSGAELPRGGASVPDDLLKVQDLSARHDWAGLDRQIGRLNLSETRPEVRESLDKLRAAAQRLHELEMLQAALGRPWSNPPDVPEVQTSLTSLLEGTKDPSLVDRVRLDLAAKAEATGHLEVARKLRDLRVGTPGPREDVPGRPPPGPGPLPTPEAPRGACGRSQRTLLTVQGCRRCLGRRPRPVGPRPRPEWRRS